MQSLREIYNQVRGPFKAKKVGLNKKSYSATTTITPIGTIAHVIEDDRGTLKGVLVEPCGKEEKMVFAQEEKIWERV